MKIWAHTLVKNEERYIWFAIGSVIEYVDKVLVWDTGSEDSTVAIIKEIKKLYPKKIEFREVGEVSTEEFALIRQEMLTATTSNWFLILDGDEVWWEDSIRSVTETIKKDGDYLESLVSPFYNVVGDIYHYQEEAAGKYEIDGRCGHINIRAINRKIPGLYASGPHGQQGYFGKDGRPIQERSADRRKFIDCPYLHFTNMIRSSTLALDSKVPKRRLKFKLELGKRFPLDFYYPEVFFKSYPSIVPSPWKKIDYQFFLKSLAITLPRKIKRRFIKGPSGY